MEFSGGTKMVVYFDPGEMYNNEPQAAITAPDSESGIDYRHFRASLRQEVVRSQRKEHPFTVMRVSVDVPIAAEDSRNQGVEQILKASIREYDLLCPLESSQFAIVFPETSEQYAEKIAHRIKGNVSQKAKSETFLLQTEIGIACFPHDGANAEDLLESAELDLMSQRKRRPH
jgi:diguanylate cyclase (GGDEF)-like protein